MCKQGWLIKLQELGDVVPHTVRCLERNMVPTSDPSRSVLLDMPWGPALVQSCTACGHFYDFVVMADVLYHVEHFDDLVVTITGCVRKDAHGSVIISTEL